jgi:acetyl esterase/lipase
MLNQFSFIPRKSCSSRGRRVISSNRLKMATANGDISINDDGRIWLHRPFQITPPAPPTSMHSGTPIISGCQLPKATPPGDRLHHQFSSSSTPEKLLEGILLSKSELYESQFRSRVATEDRKRIRRRTIQSRIGLGEVNVTIYFPSGNDGDNSLIKLNGICLHVHGGCWLWGDSYHQVAHRCLEMSQSMNVAVVSVEYSLLSDNFANLFDPVNEVLIAMHWIESSGPTELNTHHSFVGSGESCGAHLLMLAMLRRRDMEDVVLHPPVPLLPTNLCPTSWSKWKCLNLVYGVYDISGSPTVRADGDTSSPLCGNDLLWVYDLYYSRVVESMQDTTNDGTQQMRMDRRHPSFSPLYADLSHFPPALLSVGSADPLLDDSLFMASKYSSYRNHVELAVYEGGEHGVGHFGLQEEEVMGIRTRRHTLAFMNEYLQSDK